MHRFTTLARAAQALAFALTTSALATLAAPAAAQQPVARPAPPNLLAKFDVHAGTVQSLTPVPDGRGGYRTTVLLGNALRTLDLHPHDVRTPGFRLLVRDAFGVHQAPTPDNVTYRGALVEEPTTRVAAAIQNGSIDAIVHRQPGLAGPRGEAWVVQPLRPVVPGAGPAAHLVYRADDAVALPYQCGNSAATPSLGRPAAPAQGATDVTHVCDLAIEADLQFYQANGSNVVATQNDITTVMNAVDFIYDRDVDVTFNITTILVTTTSVYTTNDASNLLGQFRSNWNAQHGSIQRDVAHLFTGRNLSGSTIGIAYGSVVCSSNYGYGLSQSRFSNNFNSRVGLTAHEIGHNFSAGHCNSSSPCYIMCSGLGGCSNSVTLFGPSAIGQITSYASSSSCLAIAPSQPVISSVTPTDVTVFLPGTVTLSGSGFMGVDTVYVGGQGYTSGISVANDTSMSFLMPNSTSLGLTTLSVSNSAGTSNAVIVDYTTTAPPKMLRSASVPPAGGTAQFSFAGEPGHQWFLVLGLTTQTTPFQGYDLLSSPILLTAGVFTGPLGTDNVSVPVPGGLGLLFVWSQILEADPTQPVATGVSTVGLTLLL